MELVAIDIETANHRLSSICQLGVVTFVDGRAPAPWETLVNPEDYFHPLNVSIHGINEDAVRDAPKFPDVFTRLHDMLAQRIVVSHTPFDRVAVGRAAEKYGLPPVACKWLDSAKVARRAWREFAHAGYGLANVAQKLGITFQHHVAVEDARVAGEIVLRAIAETGTRLEDWLVRVGQPISLDRGRAQAPRAGNPDGPLSGEVVVFTGELSIPRPEAEAIAANAGCTVAKSVTKATTLLVVGDQDIRKLAGHKRSKKHRRAEALAAEGQRIRILAERDFRTLVDIENAT